MYNMDCKMSSSKSLDSCGDIAASISTSDTPHTPMSNSKQMNSSSPDFDSGSLTGITPINPFESNIADIPQIPPLGHSGSGSESANVHNTSSNMNDSRTMGMDVSDPLYSSSLEIPVSPDRSHTSTSVTNSASRSPLSTKTPAHNTFADMSASSLPQISTALAGIANSSHISQQSITPAGNTTIPNLLFEDAIVPSSLSIQSESFVTAPSQGMNTPDQPQSRRLFDDDENTEPSSAANTSVHHGGVRQVETSSQLKTTVENLSGSIKKMIEDTRRRLLIKEDRKDSDGEDVHSSALISGYLQKYGRNGKWQTRWFETDGEYLSYYKDRKKTKLLATLDLEKVGAIEVDPDDTRECCFSIQVLGRMYYLQADNRTACKDWVITLNRVKEARLQQGNVTLLNPVYDFLDSNVEVIPRVVVDANRERTRAVDEAEQWDKVYQTTNDPAHTSHTENKMISSLSSEIVARWTKRNTSSLQRLGVKVAQWARSMKKFGCEDGDEGNVHLDRNIHPPGHDDKGRNAATSKVEMKTIPDKGSNKQSNLSSISRPGGTVPSTKIAHTTCKPIRSLSATSEDYRTIS